MPGPRSTTRFTTVSLQSPAPAICVSRAWSSNESSSEVTAAIYIAGGVPKNYINDSIVMGYMFGRKDQGHRYALQLTTAVTADGGLSSSTLDEATSWGKIRSSASRAMAWVEPTVGLPLLASAGIQEGLARGRSRLEFSWNGKLLEKLASIERS